MRERKQRAAKREILATLQERHLVVVCDDCGASYSANWIDVQFASLKKFVACSEVECSCGSMLYSFIGDVAVLGHKSGSEAILHVR